MPSAIQLEDKQTMKVLKALFSGAYEISAKKVQSKTELSKSVINNRLNSLFKNKIVTGIQPSLNVVECGLATEVLSFLNFDLSEKTTLASLEKAVLNDLHMFYFGGMNSSTGINRFAFQLYHNLGEWDTRSTEIYWSGIDKFYEFVKERIHFFLPLDRRVKNTEVSRNIVELIEKDGKATNPKLSDPATLRILKALFEDVYEVSYKKIQSLTKMSKSVIHGRLDFLRDGGYMGVPNPQINAIECGFRCKVYNFLAFEKSKKELYERLIKEASNDMHLFCFGDVLEHNFNTCLFGIYRNDIEWQKSFNNYFDAMPGLYDAITNRMSMVIPLKFVHKEQSPQMSALNILECDVR